MYVSKKKIDKAITLFKEYGGILRTSEAEIAGIHNRTLYHMLDEDYIKKIERGVYKLTEISLSRPGLAIVATKIPKATICLISALDFHDMTTALPHQIHIAIPKTSRDPILNHPPLRIYRFSGKSLTEGIEYHEVDGIELKVFSPAKTIADCFKFRNNIGLDIAIEALKDGIREKKASFTEINKFAKICRVQNVIRPYAETIAHS